MSTQHPTRTTDDQAGEVDLTPFFGDGDRPDAGSPSSLPRHLAPSQRRPGLVRSLLSAVLLVTVVLAVGAVVVLGSIDRLKHPLKNERPNAAGSPGSARVGSPGAAITPTDQHPLLREGSFEAGLGAVRAERGTRLELVAGGAGSAHCARLSNSGPPIGAAGLLVDQVTRPPGLGARYSATAVVKASRPGQVVQIQLIESVGGRRVSADPQMLRLPDTQWREISVQHEIYSNGSALGLEVTFGGLGRGQFVWIDDLKVTRTL
jgi:hypothetical protein